MDPRESPSLWVLQGSWVGVYFKVLRGWSGKLPSSEFGEILVPVTRLGQSYSAVAIKAASSFQEYEVTAAGSVCPLRMLKGTSGLKCVECDTRVSFPVDKARLRAGLPWVVQMGGLCQVGKLKGYSLAMRRLGGVQGLSH